MIEPRDVGMVDHRSKASGARPQLPQAVIDLAQGAERTEGAEVSYSDAAKIELALTDLVSDANGEVVIFNDSALRTLTLHADAAVVDGGRARHHVTAGGDDVSGFNYLRFESGITIYFPEDLDLIVCR